MDNVILKGLVEQVMTDGYFKFVNFGVEVLGSKFMTYRMDGGNVCLSYMLGRQFSSIKSIVIEV